MTENKRCASWKLSLALALTGNIALGGCSEGEAYVTRDEAADIADEAVDASGFEARIAELETRLEEAETDINGVRDLGLENASNAESLATTVSGNARISNENALRDMTRRGACGYRQFNPPKPVEGGGFILSEPIPCTEADLR